MRRPRIWRQGRQSSAFPHTGWLCPSLRGGPITFPWSGPEAEDCYRCSAARASGIRTQCLPPKYRLEGQLSSGRLSSAAQRPFRCGNRRLEHGSSASVFPALVALPFHLISPEQGGRKGEISEIRHFLTYFWPRMDRRTQGFLPHSRLPRPACGI